MKYEIDKSDLDRIERELNNLEAGTADAFKGILSDIVSTWRATSPKDSGKMSKGIAAVRAIDTNSDLKASAFERVSAAEFVQYERMSSSELRSIITSGQVGYEGFVERGTKKFPANASARRALDELDARDFVRGRMDSEIDKVLKN